MGGVFFCHAYWAQNIIQLTGKTDVFSGEHPPETFVPLEQIQLFSFDLGGVLWHFPASIADTAGGFTMHGDVLSVNVDAATSFINHHLNLSTRICVI